MLRPPPHPQKLYLRRPRPRKTPRNPFFGFTRQDLLTQLYLIHFIPAADAAPGRIPMLVICLQFLLAVCFERFCRRWRFSRISGFVRRRNEIWCIADYRQNTSRAERIRSLGVFYGYVHNRVSCNMREYPFTSSFCLFLSFSCHYTKWLSAGHIRSAFCQQNIETLFVACVVVVQTKPPVKVFIKCNRAFSFKYKYHVTTRSSIKYCFTSSSSSSS